MDWKREMRSADWSHSITGPIVWFGNILLVFLFRSLQKHQILRIRKKYWYTMTYHFYTFPLPHGFEDLKDTKSSRKHGARAGCKASPSFGLKLIWELAQFGRTAKTTDKHEAWAICTATPSQKDSKLIFKLAQFRKTVILGKGGVQAACETRLVLG